MSAPSTTRKAEDGGSFFDRGTRLQASANLETPLTGKDHDRLDGEYRFGKRRVPITHEFEKNDFLRGALHEEPWRLDPAGDGGHTKFGKGFWRRSGIGEQFERSRRDEEEARAARAEVARVARAERLEATEKRNAFNVISGAFDPAKNPANTRGRRFLDGKPTDLMKKEGVHAMRDTALRFFRLETLREPTMETLRAAKLGADGLDHRPRMSSLLGLGRADLPSAGAHDCFDLADYGGLRPATEDVRLRTSSDHSLAASASGGGGAGGGGAGGGVGAGGEGSGRADPFAERMEREMATRRLERGHRAPNRIFDLSAKAVIRPAVPDEEKRVLRIEREIKRSLPPRPADRPKSLLAEAARLKHERERRTVAAEVESVRSLVL